MAGLLAVAAVLTIAAAIAHGDDLGSWMLLGIAAVAFARAAARRGDVDVSGGG